MSRVRVTLEIAWWEFRRFFKPREQAVTLGIVVLSSFLFSAIAGGRGGAGEKPIRVAVIGIDAEEIALSPKSRLRLETRPAGDEAALRVAVDRRKLDGLLLVGREGWRVVARRDPDWRPELERALHARERALLLRAQGVPDSVARRLETLPEVAVEVERAAARSGLRASRVVAVAFLIFTIGALLLGTTYLLVGISGEKQQRVTEQVLSAVSPQTWIDGKILGLAGVALGSCLTFLAGFVLFALAAAGIAAIGLGAQGATSAGGAHAGPGGAAERGASILATLASLDTGIITLSVAFAFLGFLLWFTFFAAVAATINDPNSSQRGIFMFLPMVAASAAFLGLGDPDGGLARFLSLLPFTANAAMPMRMTLTEVPWWEPALSLAGIVISIHLLRVAAGKIFAVGMLLYGKEPSLSEMWRWIREA